MSNYVVFRSPTGIRAVELGAPGTGVPEGQAMRDDEKFGVVVDDVPSPEAAIWRAALEYHEDAIAGLMKVLVFYLDEIDWDRDSTKGAEVVDEVFKSLHRLHKEGLSCTQELEDLTPHWSVPEEEVEPEENLEQLTLI